jgi:lipid-binding SYLF domain-containing protein
MMQDEWRRAGWVFGGRSGGGAVLARLLSVAALGSGLCYRMNALQVGVRLARLPGHR